MLKILANTFMQIKIKVKILGSLITTIFFSLLKWLDWIVVKIFCDFIMLIQKNSICLISFFNLCELSSAFICTNNIGSLVNNFFRVKIFNPVPVFFLFQWYNFTSSAIVSSGSILLLPNLLVVVWVVNRHHLHLYLIINQELSFRVYLEHLPFSSELLKDYHIQSSYFILLNYYHI